MYACANYTIIILSNFVLAFFYLFIKTKHMHTGDFNEQERYPVCSKKLTCLFYTYTRVVQKLIGLQHYCTHFLISVHNVTRNKYRNMFSIYNEKNQYKIFTDNNSVKFSNNKGYEPLHTLTIQ
jgi:hypothetical protein